MAHIRILSKLGSTVLGLGLVVVLLAACGSSSTQAQTNGTSSFHTALGTTDGRFQLQVNVSPDRFGKNTFTVNIADTSSGKAVTNVHVRLFITMLDMDMGSTTVVDMQSGSQGQYSAQSQLAMNGHWGIRIRLLTPDSLAHEANVRLLITS